MKRSLAAVSIALLTSGLLTGVATTAYAAPAAPTPEASAVARAEAALRANGAAVRAAAGETYAAYSSKVDPNGAAHTRYTRAYHGLRVAGGDFVVHTAPNGSFAGSSVGLVTPSRSAPPPGSARGRQPPRRRRCSRGP